MINNEITTTKGMESAQKALEQAKNRVAVEKKKANEERRSGYSGSREPIFRPTESQCFGRKWASLLLLDCFL